MKCPQCDYECPPDFDFCPKCATPMQVRCPECGFRAPAGFAFCPMCATKLAAAAKEPSLPALDEAIQRLVPREFAERLLATRGQMHAERRMVTILFADVQGSTPMAEDLDPEDVMEIMDAAFDHLIEPILRYEGTLARLMGDGVLAFFGAPIAHEDDPERACRAALEIVERARTYAEKLERERRIAGFTVRVGINTGLVVVGEVGSDLRVEYTAMGDAINLASRMEQSAPPGGILITHDTYRHVRGVFSVRAQEPLQVKGRREPVRAYLVLRTKPRAFRAGTRGVEGIETRMIGREAELSRLESALYDAVEDRELQMVTVAGDAGVGKSRLLYEFENSVELLPDTVLYFKGRALQEMQSMPYSLIRSLFSFRFQIEDTDSVPQVREKLEAGMAAALGQGEQSRQAPRAARRAAHFIGHLLGFELGESPHLEGLLDDPKQMRDRALTYLGDYFRALAAQDPLLILLEDLHWADDSSLDALNQLALALVDEPVMIACAARPALFQRRPHWGEGQAFHRRLPLEPLTKRNTRRLLHEILQKAQEVPQTLSDLVVAGAEGNPFFVEELIKMLVEDGVIVKGEDQWRVEPSRLSEVRVPPTLRGVLQARLDRLPIEDRTVLQQASVVGRLFWDRAVVRVSESAAEGVEEGQVLDALSELHGREMVFQRETTAFAGSREYVFKHAVLREVTYRSLLKRLRRVYHGLVADWLIEQAGERAGEYTGLIADHLELAGRSKEAIEYLLEAGDRARGLYAHQEAIGAYERAMAILKDRGDHERAARTLMRLGLTYHTAFNFRSARQAYEEGFALWQRVGEMEVAVLPPAPHALRIHWSDPPTLDPTRADDVTSGLVVAQLFRGLVTRTPEMEVVPDVARTWEVLDGGRTYVFHLRDDVRWSDGAPVTAADFEYAWKRVLDPAADSWNARLLCDVKGASAYHQGHLSDPDYVGVRATDELTLAVELEEPAGYFLHLLADHAAFPVPRHVVKTHGQAWTEVRNIVTNGPFRLEAWERGERMVLARNPVYCGRFRGNVERVELSLVAGWSARLQMYEIDDLDVFDLRRVPLQEKDRARQRHAGEYVSVPELTTTYVGFDVSRPPFSDPRVRRAFVLALDRETLADVTLGGYGFPATGGFVPPRMPGHSPGIGLPYDPSQAQRLLAEAGYAGGRGFPTVDALTSGDQPLTEFTQAQWRDNLGIEIAWERTDWAMFLDRMAERPPQMYDIAWIADYPDPDSFLRSSHFRRQTGWQNEAYERLVEKARRVTDQGERMRLYGQADRILVEEAPILPLTYYRSHLLVKPWVSKYPTPALKSWRFEDVVIEPH